MKIARLRQPERIENRSAMWYHEHKREVEALKIRIERVEEYSARQLAAEMLADAVGTAPEDIPFCRGENGKPLTSLPLHFNCSHSGGFVVCAVGERELGVDLERIRPVRSRLERALTASERQWLASLPPPERDEGFFRLWTLKESWIKCRGGRLMELRRAEFLLQGREIVSAPSGFIFRFLPAPMGYVLAICERE